MTDPNPSAGEAVRIDPAIALRETKLLMQAIDTHYHHRNLILAQQAHDLAGQLAASAQRVTELEAALGAKEPS
ncbi:hypothetical protein [Aliihoeflea sp. 2WW]|uniref:hypothetical protein n=1 Tax=Aliihoeflea sp. 2WW TaxID=1381123 RepID=UPI0004635F93|nr:hypothetical protein [Aliihoeflea sp. 2WW]